MAWLLRRDRQPRALVLGWDCAGPELVFDQLHRELPALSQLRAGGTWGALESSIPCITVPAWTSMLSSRDPGALGIYGFRNRADHSYRAMTTATSAAVHAPRLWDCLSAAGRESVVLNVPQTYPVRPLNGHLVSCFLTPGIDSAFTYPAAFRHEVLSVAPGYRFDVKDFRTHDKDALLRQLTDLAEIQFRLALHCLKSKPWDFFMHVNIGLDRVQHGFWRYHDPRHRLHEPGSRFAGAVASYYRMLDEMAGQLVEQAGDNTLVLVVSDHGVKRMDGGICVNEWLWRAGWLAFHNPPPAGRLTRFEELDVDWARTRAWASGGYYGRVFLNVSGREPQGIIPPAAYAETRAELAALLAAIPDAAGAPLATRAYQPEAIYSAVRGVAPDLLVYFGDLHWRAVGSLGHGRHYTLENDTGPDDANHAQQGMFALYDPRRRGAGRVEGAQLMDITPTLLRRLGVAVPAEMQGRAL